MCKRNYVYWVGIDLGKTSRVGDGGVIAITRLASWLSSEDFLRQ
jgi:hypothetical protein